MSMPEYEYVALQPIDHNGVRAYNTGDPVPAKNVKENRYKEGEQVAKRNSEAGKAAEAKPSDGQPA